MSASEAEQLWNEMRLGTAAAPTKGTGVPGLLSGRAASGSALIHSRGEHSEGIVVGAGPSRVAPKYKIAIKCWRENMSTC